MQMSKDTRLSTRLGIALGLTIALAAAPALAQPATPELAEVRQILDRQQSLIETQSEAIRRQTEQIELQARQLEEQRQLLQGMQARLDELALQQGQVVPSDQEIADRERMSRVEEVLESPPDASDDVLRAGEFPGSIRIPGTNLAGQIGGFVRLGVVDSFDPIGSDDRFVVGSIPVGETGSGEDARRATISAKRSRLSLDMRMDSSYGQFRAFIEGDFAGEGGTDNYRLRHAFGQYREFLIGQTWSTLVDRRALPEDLDFEGLNARINFRQAMVRWSTIDEIGRRFAVSLEDPAPEVTGGNGVSVVPDLLARAGRDYPWGHLRAAVLLRDVVGTPERGDKRASEFGWGSSFSGLARMPWNQRDNLKFQLSYGDGIGRYINDLDSVGGQDAVFDPQGQLRALPAFGGYVAYQHFWDRDLLGLLRNLRSTFVYGLVNVQNFDFQPDDAYDRTRRASLNLIWSPISSLDLGLEYLWGERRNKDKQIGRAGQVQFVSTFRF